MPFEEVERIRADHLGTPQEIIWYQAQVSGTCYAIRPDTFDYQIVRRNAYLKGLDGLLWRAFDRDRRPGVPWPVDAESAGYRERYFAVMGRAWDTPAEAWEWMVANRKFFRWSEDTQTLVIDEQAQAADAWILERIPEMAPARYWRAIAIDRITLEGAQEGYLVGRRQWFEGGAKFKVLASSLEDQAAKHTAYVARVAYRVRVAQEDPGSGNSERALARLKTLTTKDFETPQEWQSWFEKYKDRLVVSEDGERLVVPWLPSWFPSFGKEK